MGEGLAASNRVPHLGHKTSLRNSYNIAIYYVCYSYFILTI